MSEHEQFARERRAEIEAMAQDQSLTALTRSWMDRAQAARYSYHFEWLGRPIIQYPQDIIAVQEIMWSVKPDLVIETGIARGGSLIFSASMLALNSLCGGPPDAAVIGVDIDIRPQNRAAIEAHPLSGRITMIQGSSIAADVIEQVRKIAAGKSRVLVLLDSNHTHAHVLAELAAYAPLVSAGSYCVVFDTVVEDLPADSFADRPWGRGNNPKTAVMEFLKNHAEFELDRAIENKLQITVAPHGYLRRVV